MWVVSFDDVFKECVQRPTSLFLPFRLPLLGRPGRGGGGGAACCAAPGAPTGRSWRGLLLLFPFPRPAPAAPLLRCLILCLCKPIQMCYVKQSRDSGCAEHMRPWANVMEDSQMLFFPGSHPVVPGAKGWKSRSGNRNQVDKSSDYQHLPSTSRPAHSSQETKPQQPTASCLAPRHPHDKPTKCVYAYCTSDASWALGLVGRVRKCLHHLTWAQMQCKKHVQWQHKFGSTQK